MSNKHYNADYLLDTAKVMQEIKLNSYQKFIQLPQGAILDIGCGTGADVINIAKMSPNQISVYGLDHDEQLIGIAKENSAGVDDVQFLVSEVTQIPFADNFFSGIRSERLIQHLDSVDIVFNEVFRALMPGAPFVIVETDWSSLCFYNGSTEVSTKIVDYLTHKKVKNGFASKRILEYYGASNFIHPSLQIHPLVANNLQDVYTYLWMDKIIEEMAVLGILSQEEKNQFVAALEQSNQNKSFACSLNIVVASAEKP